LNHPPIICPSSNIPFRFCNYNSVCILYTCIYIYIIGGGLTMHVWYLIMRVLVCNVHPAAIVSTYLRLQSYVRNCAIWRIKDNSPF
jgi:hypothetical protein